LINYNINLPYNVRRSLRRRPSFCSSV